MRISLKWLMEYVDIPKSISIETISQALTMAGLEVESVEDYPSILKECVVAKITQAEGADHDFLYTLSGQNGSYHVPFRSGDLKIGAWVLMMPSLAKKILGKMELSESARGDGTLVTPALLRLPLGNESSPIELSDEQWALAQKEGLARALELDDVVFEIGVTPNRPDALSHLGVARELAAVLDLRVRSHVDRLQEWSSSVHEKVYVHVLTKEACPRFSCRVIEGVKVGPSPTWLKNRLALCGIRSINNVVDATNLVMLGRGQPLHAFDLDELAKEQNGRVKVVVRMAKPGEPFLALDGKSYNLTAEDLVVADQDQALSLAGVMGGLASSVKTSTKRVLLESAYFLPIQIRKTARRHGIGTESSFRFERGTDPNGVIAALDESCALIMEQAQGQVSKEAIDVYSQRIEPLEIKFRLAKAEAICGFSEPIDQQELLRKFLKLGIETFAKLGETICFRIPTYRPDLVREIDLIEELVRLFGYDRVADKPKLGQSQAENLFDWQWEKTVLQLQNDLVSRGFFETVSLGFSSLERCLPFYEAPFKEQAIALQNPLGERLSIMRPSLLPGLLANLSLNVRQGESNIRLFEIGTVFHKPRPEGQFPLKSALSAHSHQDAWADERSHVAWVWYGLVGEIAADQKRRAVDFYDAKGLISELLNHLGIKDGLMSSDVIYQKTPPEWGFLHPVESARIVLKMAHGPYEPIGFMGKLHPTLASSYDLINPVFVAELDLDKISSQALKPKRFQEINRLPGIERDLALLVDETMEVKELSEAAKRLPHASEILEDIRIFDIYKGKNIPAGKKSVGIRFYLKSKERTLKDEDANQFIEAFLKNCAGTLRA